MAKDKKSFVLYADLIHSVEHLTNEEKGILFQHLLDYVNDKKPVLTERLLIIAWKPIEIQLERDLKKFKEVKKRRSEAGKRGMSKRWSDDNVITNDNKNNKCYNVITKITDNVNDNDNDNDNVNVNDNVINKKNKDKSLFQKPTIEELKKYCTERNNFVDCEKFYDFYESKAWMVGKNKMKDWKASVRTWEKTTEKPKETYKPKFADSKW